MRILSIRRNERKRDVRICDPIPNSQFMYFKETKKIVVFRLSVYLSLKETSFILKEFSHDIRAA